MSYKAIVVPLLLFGLHAHSRRNNFAHGGWDLDQKTRVHGLEPHPFLPKPFVLGAGSRVTLSRVCPSLRLYDVHVFGSCHQAVIKKARHLVTSN